MKLTNKNIMYYHKLREMCIEFLCDFFSDNTISDIMKQEVLKKIVSKLKCKDSHISLYIRNNDKEFVKEFNIKWKRRDYYTEINRWRKQLFKKYGYKCVKCNNTNNLECHHIKGWAEYPESRFDIDNGQVLCLDCHSKTDNYKRNNNAIRQG